MKTILINQNTQEKRVQVPDEATVTFGGLIPGAKVDGGSNRTALRIYIGKRQIGVFTSVTDFRFVEDISVLEKRTNTASKNVAVNEDGIQKLKAVSVTTEEWVNPDETQPKSENPLLLLSLSKEAQ